MAIRRISIGVVLALVLLAIIIGVSSNARAAAVCSPTSTVSGAYAQNGAGDVCFQTANLCSYINSWNLSALEVNGTDYTNRWVDSRSIGALNGAYIVHYVASFPWSHFEIGGPCGTVQPTTPPVTTPPVTTPPVTTPPVTTPPVTTPPVTTPPVTTPPPGSVSINSGGPATGDFSADQYFSGGSTYTNTRTIDMSYIPANMVPAAIFSTERYGTMTYTIPNRSGNQTVTLYFAETYVTAAGQRVFNVVVNGQTVLSNYDIFARAGAANRAIYHRFVTTANSSGQVVIQFTAVTQNPKISGITVVAGGTITPPPTTPPATTPPVTTPPVTTPPPTTPPPTTPPPTTPPPGTILDNLDNYNTSLFQKADGWTNGDPFNVGWRADHVNFAGGIMTITLDNQTCPSGCSNRPYASGEYRRTALTGYGRYEARFKAAKASGIVAASLFTYTGPSDNQPWDEIDIEILGKDTTRMQTNYYTNGTGGHESMINLGFDAAAGFHTYAFEWTASSIRWYVDGALVHTENGSRGALPTHQSKLMMNMWPGIGVDGWLGAFNYTGPLQFQVDWIKYTPMQ